MGIPFLGRDASQDQEQWPGRGADISPGLCGRVETGLCAEARTQTGHHESVLRTAVRFAIHVTYGVIDLALSRKACESITTGRGQAIGNAHRLCQDVVSFGSRGCRQNSGLYRQIQPLTVARGTDEAESCRLPGAKAPARRFGMEPI